MRWWCGLKENMISLGILTDLLHHAQKFYCWLFSQYVVLHSANSPSLIFFHCALMSLGHSYFHPSSFLFSVFEPLFHLKAPHQTPSNLYSCLGRSLISVQIHFYRISLSDFLNFMHMRLANQRFWFFFFSVIFVFLLPRGQADFFATISILTWLFCRGPLSGLSRKACHVWISECRQRHKVKTSPAALYWEHLFNRKLY